MSTMFDKKKVKNKVAIDFLPPWRVPEITVTGSVPEVLAILLGIAIVSGVAIENTQLTFELSVAFTLIRGITTYKY